MPRTRDLRSLLTPSSTKRNFTPGPPSPTFSDTTQATQASAMNFGDHGPTKIITRANLKASMQAYEELIKTSATYRAALLTMSKVTAAFADAMGKCAGLKGTSYESGTRLQAASGLHHLIGNHWHILADTLDRKFEKPLRQQLEAYRVIVTERSISYERALSEKSRVIQRTERENLNRKERNLQTFREALAVMQRQVEELDQLKIKHYQAIMDHEAEVWDGVAGTACLVVRSSMDIFDKFTAKASDPVIESMLQTVLDPFDSYVQPHSEDHLFSILPPLSMATQPPSHAPSPLPGVPAKLAAPDVTAWMPTLKTDNSTAISSSAQWAEVPSSPSSSTSVSPVSSVSPNLTHASGSTHRPRQQEAQSRLRTILSVVSEGRGSSCDDDVISSPSSLNGDTTGNWDNSPDASLYHNDKDTTPRHSLLFASLPPTHDPNSEADRPDATEAPDEAIQVAVLS